MIAPRLSLLVVLAACHARAPATTTTSPPTNTESDPAGDVTNLRVSIGALFNVTCPARNPIEVTIDGVARTEDFPCEESQSYTDASGKRVVVTGSGLSRHEMAPVPLGPGRHRIRVRHVPSNVSGEIEIVLPQYAKGSKQPTKLDLLEVRVPDTDKETEVGKGVMFTPELMSGTLLSF